MLSDDELLHIEGEPPEGYDPAKARRQLAEHGDAFRYQLVEAIHLEELAKMFEEQRLANAFGELGGSAFADGRAAALRDVVANLRRGDYLPGGSCYEEIVPQLN